MKTVQDFEIEFVEVAVQVKEQRKLILKQEHNELVDSEIRQMLEKGAIVTVEDRFRRFLSTLFW